MKKQQKETTKQKSPKGNLHKLSIAQKSMVEEPTKSESSFDFGGLPKCDLKKNLGCG
jgi:hypothetical protein